MNKMNTPAKQFSWNTAVLLSLGAGLFAVGLSVTLQARSANTVDYLAAGPMPAVTQSAVGAGAAFKLPGRPVELIIPAIGVHAHIQSVGLAWQGTGDMGIPTNFTDVAWYNKGPLPGAPGSAVIDGHLDGRNTPKAVFYDLGKLKVGDLVEVVDTKGQTLQFRVVGSATYDYDAPTHDIFSGDTSKARLNLITCAGDWIKAQKLYNQRVVVFTELVSTS